mmetsp:Transcript_35756/g.106714  ORF Transcript_35756/g.106714 Transcript_35756/m.106714 type:complete len:233 (+) Transcript_35756:939-1637(+)
MAGIRCLRRLGHFARFRGEFFLGGTVSMRASVGWFGVERVERFRSRLPPEAGAGGVRAAVTFELFPPPLCRGGLFLPGVAASLAATAELGSAVQRCETALSAVALDCIKVLGSTVPVDKPLRLPPCVGVTGGLSNAFFLMGAALGLGTGLTPLPTVADSDGSTFPFRPNNPGVGIISGLSLMKQSDSASRNDILPIALAHSAQWCPSPFGSLVLLPTRTAIMYEGPPCLLRR